MQIYLCDIEKLFCELLLNYLLSAVEGIFQLTDDALTISSTKRKYK